MSQRDVARLMGVSSATIAAAELGGDPRRSTLERLAASLPLLDPRRLLLSDECVPPLTHDCAWRLLRSACGVSATRAQLRSREGILELEVHGLRRTDGASWGGADDVEHVLAALAGDHSAVARELAEGVRNGEPLGITVEHEGATHALRAATDSAGGLTYMRRQPAGPPHPDRALLAHAPAIPVETLVLVTAAEAAGPGRPAAIVRGLGLERALPAPGAAVSRDPATGETKATFTRPLPFVSHELRFVQADGDVPHAAATPRSADAATALRAARLRAGLSCRALASRLGLSVATVHGAENGLDARRSTLVALLSALPSLKPEDLIAPGDPGRDATKAETWETYRRLYGVEAEEERVSLQVRADGGATEVRTFTGLRRPDGTGPLVLRVRGNPRAAADDPGTIEAVGGDVSDLRTRLVRGAGGRHEHELTVSAGAASRGVSARRRVALQARVPVHPEDPAAMRTPEGDAIATTTVTPAIPCRRLVLDVTLPDGRPARSFRVAAWAPGTEHGRDLLPELHPNESRLESNLGRTSARLVVEEPLIGFRYALTWTLD